MDYGFNSAILILAFFTIKSQMKLNNKFRKPLLFITAIIDVYMISMTVYTCATTAYVFSSSPDHEQTIVIEKATSTNEMSLYLKSGILWKHYVTKISNLNQDGYIKNQWLNSKNISITYGDESDVKQAVFCFSDYNINHIDTDLRTSIRGTWASSDQQTIVSEDSYGIMITDHGQSDYFLRENCKASDYALVLYKNHKPVWTIVPRDNSNVDKGIIICPVSLGKSSPILLHSAPYLSLGTSDSMYDETSYLAPKSGQMDKGNQIASEMKNILLYSPSLSNFQNSLSSATVKTNSSNIYWVVRLADELIHKQFVYRGIQSDVQIEDMTLIFGNSKDFLMKVDTSECFTGSDTIGCEREYRVMRGNGVYLVVIVPSDTDCSGGLSRINSPVAYTTKSNPQYSYQTY